MSRQELYRYSDICEERCIPSQDQDIYSHQDTNEIEHKYMRHKHFTDHFKKYQTFLQPNILRLQQYKQSILVKLSTLKQQIALFEKNLESKMGQCIQCCQFDFFNDASSKDILLSYKKDGFKFLTCREMSKLINLTDVKLVSSKEKDIKTMIDTKIEELQTDFQEFVKRSFKSSKIEIVSLAERNLLNMIKLNQSSISKVNNSNLTEELAIDQFFNVNEEVLPVKVDMGKKAGYQMVEEADQQKIEIVQDEDQSYYSQKYSQNKAQTNTNMTSKLSEFKNQSQEKIKAETVSQFQSDDHKQQNEQQICKQIQLFEQSMNESKQPTQQQQQIEELHTIQELDDLLQIEDLDEFTFNIRVKVVKVLYFAVILSKILKVKFIAGDQTGISVFFTNYCSKIKPGVELELTNCHISIFKQSQEIGNDKNYRIINEGKDTIKVNLQGIYLSQFIQPNLQYLVNDKNCILVRQIASKLAKKSSFIVGKMVVKVIFIMNNWLNRVFCQVGDSSGRMLAYIKKDGGKAINEGDVLKLLKVSCKRGIQPNKLINEEILYLDTQTQNCKVLSFMHEFLDVSQTIYGVD